jgi:glutathione S-transferase
MLTIYGSPQSSAGRCFWCLEEVGASYEQKSISFKDQEHKSAEFLAVNPNGKVPALIDGDFTIWESMAINFYLAEAYKPEILGSTAKEKGLVHQWSIWSIADLQPPLIAIFIQLIFVPEERRDHAIIKKSQEKLPAMLNILNLALERNSYLLGESFSLADLNVSTVVAICDQVGVSLADYPAINQWQERLGQRDSFKRYQALLS